MFAVLKILYLLMNFGDNGTPWEDDFGEDNDNIDRNHFVQLDGDVQRSKPSFTEEENCWIIQNVLSRTMSFKEIMDEFYTTFFRKISKGYIRHVREVRVNKSTY